MILELNGLMLVPLFLIRLVTPLFLVNTLLRIQHSTYWLHSDFSLMKETTNRGPGCKYENLYQSLSPSLLEKEFGSYLSLHILWFLTG